MQNNINGTKKVTFKVVPDTISETQKGSIPVEGEGWLLFDPNCYWRILEFELPFYSKIDHFRANGKYEYEVVANNYPLLKQVNIEYYEGLSKKPTSRMVIDYVFEKRIPLDEEFKLSAFGLPEPKFTGPIPWWNSPRVLLSITALAFCGITILLFRFNKKKT